MCLQFFKKRKKKGFILLIFDFEVKYEPLMFLTISLRSIFVFYSLIFISLKKIHKTRQCLGSSSGTVCVCIQAYGLSDKSVSMSCMALEVFCRASEMQFSVSLISDRSGERSRLRDLAVERRTGLFSNKTDALC